jgi:hypothetical protein
MSWNVLEVEGSVGGNTPPPRRRDIATAVPSPPSSQRFDPPPRDATRSFTPADTGWQAWTKIGDPRGAFHGPVTSTLFKGGVEVDLFSIGTDQNVYTTIAVAGVSRMDVFMTPSAGALGPIAMCRFDVASGWGGWAPIRTSCDPPFTATSIHVSAAGEIELVIAVDTNGVAHAANRPVSLLGLTPCASTRPRTFLKAAPATSTFATTTGGARGAPLSNEPV